MAQFQWFPGHMAKTLRELKEVIKLCDLVIEVCDSRIVSSSRNPLVDDLCSTKPRILVLNKKDLADPAVSTAWLEYFKSQNQAAVVVDARKRNEVQIIKKMADKICEPILERAKSRGRRNYQAGVLVVGIPNCGKSTLINSLIGKRKAETANKPGVTRSLSWWKLGKNLHLMDSPGLLWQKIESQEQAINLGACGAIKDEIMPREELAAELVLKLFELYPEAMREKFNFSINPLQEIAALSKEEQKAYLLNSIAENFVFINQDESLNLDRTATFILKQFRSAKLGKISLEHPN